MSEGDAGKPTFDKGDRAAIVSGRQNVGVRGEIFWVGENKYGPGMRYGLRGDDGGTHWVDEQDIGREEDAPPAPASAGPGSGTEPGEGRPGEDHRRAFGVGVEGAVFWTGASKYGNQMRYGVKGDDEETYWVDADQVEALAKAEAAPDAPPPADDELPPEAFEGEGLPPEAYEDDVPF